MNSCFDGLGQFPTNVRHVADRALGAGFLKASHVKSRGQAGLIRPTIAFKTDPFRG